MFLTFLLLYHILRVISYSALIICMFPIILFAVWTQRCRSSLCVFSECVLSSSRWLWYVLPSPEATLHLPRVKQLQRVTGGLARVTALILYPNIHFTCLELALGQCEERHAVLHTADAHGPVEHTWINSWMSSRSLEIFRQVCLIRAGVKLCRTLWTLTTYRWDVCLCCRTVLTFPIWRPKANSSTSAVSCLSKMSCTLRFSACLNLELLVCVRLSKHWRIDVVECEPVLCEWVFYQMTHQKRRGSIHQLWSLMRVFTTWKDTTSLCA